jgi:hypothetical protein
MAYDSILGIAELARKYGVFDHRVRNLLTVALYTDDAELEHDAAVYVTGRILHGMSRRHCRAAVSL